LTTKDEVEPPTGADTQPPTPDEIFLQAIGIVEEIEDKLELVVTTLSKASPNGEEAPDYAERVRSHMPAVLFLLLRRVHRVRDRLIDAYDSLSNTPPADP